MLTREATLYSELLDKVRDLHSRVSNPDDTEQKDVDVIFYYLFDSLIFRVKRCLFWYMPR